MSSKRYKTVSQWTRAKILKRDSYTCQGCGRVEPSTFPVRGLQIHHIRPFRDSRDDSPENLTTLCLPCHAKADHDHRSRLSKIARAAYFAKRGIVAKKRVAAKPISLCVDVSQEEWVRVSQMCRDAGLSISDLIRQRLGLC